MIDARLCVVTDRRATGGRDLVAVLDEILAALPAGAAIVQLREKDLEGAALLALTRAVIAVARPRRAAVLVNDRLDVALAADADGVHLPEHGISIPTARRIAAAGGRADLLIGASTHTAEAATAAAHAGADLVILGPIWPTPSKQAHGEPLGLAPLRAAALALASPARLFAIGGIATPAEAAGALTAGADGIAAIRAFLAAADPAAAARALWAAVANPAAPPSRP